LPANLLELEQISYRYNAHSQLVLDDVTLKITEGSVTAVLGPNGAGKSTLLDLCLGWKEAETGRILLRGREISSYSRKEMGQLMSLVPQNERVRFDYSVLEYLLLGRAPYLSQLEMPKAEDLGIAERALATVGIPELRHRSASRLSGGEHQLLMIARALVQEPEILILDEPTSQLDPGNRQRVVRLLRELHAQGVTIIFSTHDPGLAAALASHAVLLKKGKILQAGVEESVLKDSCLSTLYDTEMRVLRQEGKTIVYCAE